MKMLLCPYCRKDSYTEVGADKDFVKLMCNTCRRMFYRLKERFPRE